MKRKIFLGNIKYENPKIANNDCYVEITYERKTGNKWVFSATGEIWNKNRSDILCGGQCLDTLNDYFSDNETFKAIYRLWKLYHLNDMHAECEHQRALGWDKLASEHPDGLLSKPCPVCGYKYGTSWQYMPIPQNDHEKIMKLFKG